MHELFTELIRGLHLTGNVRSDMTLLLFHHGHPETADHCIRVAAEAERLAVRFGANRSIAQVAGWLHDISAVFPAPERAQIARQLGIAVLPEEGKAPMILHQKLSAVMAEEIFQVQDRAALSAIECHTTLKANASIADKVVFIADKIEWDQSGDPPFLEGIMRELGHSLDRAVLHYLQYLWQRRSELQVVHPWFVDAYRQLVQTVAPQ